MLLYLYTADYPDLLTDTFEGSPASQLTGEQGSELLATHTQVYAIADRLDIQELRQASNRKFKEAFDSCSPDDFAAVVLEVGVFAAICSQSEILPRLEHFHATLN